MHKLAIVSTHPIQYNAPLFRLLTSRNRIEVKVFYTWSQSQNIVQDMDFGISYSWDIPLLEGYDYEFVENVSSDPGTHHNKGIINPGLYDKIWEYSPKAVLIYGWNFKSHLSLIAKLSGKLRILFRGDSTLLDESVGIKYFLRRAYLKNLYQKIDCALYVGKANRRYFEAMGVNDNRLIYAPHAVDNDRFITSEPIDLSLHKMPTRKPNDFVILFAGKLTYKKGIDLLLKAIEELKQQGDQRIRLVIVGDGSLKPLVASYADTFDWVDYLGFLNQSQMSGIYKMADLYCLPSRGPGETWGLAVNEAMASGTVPLVSTAVGCAEDLVSNTNLGFVFMRDSLDSLISQIKLVINMSQPELGKLSLDVQNFIKHHHNYDITVEAIESQIIDA